MAAKRKISPDLEELKKSIADLQPDRKEIAEKLYNKLTFMEDTLNLLQEQIKEEGPTAMFEQGRQKFLREHPALKAYNTTIQRYSLLYKQLTDLLPKVTEKPQADPLINFVKEGFK